jgi:hypothetical protein
MVPQAMQPGLEVFVAFVALLIDTKAMGTDFSPQG